MNTNDEFQYLVVYTDGSCIGNGTPSALASWSYIVTDDNNNVIEASTGKLVGRQDSNRAELTAMLKALQYIRNQRHKNFIIRTDYEAVIRFLNGTSVPKSNYDLYREIEYLYKLISNRVKIEKVKAHKNHLSITHSMNGIVDNLARKAFDLFNINK